MTFRLVADDPPAVTSASGLLTFTAPEPGAAPLALAAAALARVRRPALRRT